MLACQLRELFQRLIALAYVIRLVLVNGEHLADVAFKIVQNILHAGLFGGVSYVGGENFRTTFMP